ncbi:MAG: hypothetical protein L0F84_04655, partial [Lactococcus raffinolactis]|nr:hypothetical protein [Lactococcus raffinolactis]
MIKKIPSVIDKGDPQSNYFKNSCAKKFTFLDKIPSILDGLSPESLSVNKELAFQIDSSHKSII